MSSENVLYSVPRNISIMILQLFTIKFKHVFPFGFNLLLCFHVEYRDVQLTVLWENVCENEFIIEAFKPLGKWECIATLPNTSHHGIWI